MKSAAYGTWLQGAAGAILSLSETLWAKRRRLACVLLVAAFLFGGMELTARYEYMNYLHQPGGMDSLKPTGWKLFMAPCASDEGCRIQHIYFSDRGLHLDCIPQMTLPYVSPQYEEYSFLWFKERRYTAPYIRYSWYPTK